jgi:hypothetical protein
MSALALEAAKFNTQFNREMLVAHGLPEGNYDLQIDDRMVGRWSSAELAEGINLATIDTPKAWLSSAEARSVAV